MSNRFYDAFDQETWGGARRPDYRSCFQVDRDRVIHAHAFRKLQSKTQVFLSGEYDFYRTRLTHSMEVAQIGRSICTWLLSRGAPLGPDFFIDSDLVEAVCLAHDLGHPPFGHSGERTLQELMRTHGGFEGNAQTLHLLTETMFQNESGVRGMQPSRALLDGVLKYKRLHREFAQPPANHFLYDPQIVYRDFVFGGKTPDSLLAAGDTSGCISEINQVGVSGKDGSAKTAEAEATQRVVPLRTTRAQPSSPLTHGVRRPEVFQKYTLNSFKSVECQIMDWADDAAYSLNDIVDGVRAGFLTIERMEAWAAETGIDAERQGHLDTLFAAIRGDRLEEVFSDKLGRFITGCRLRERTGTNPMAARTNRYRYELVVAAEAEREAAFYKRIANDLIFESPQLQQMEHKARRILFDLWSAAWTHYVEPGPRVIRLLPPRVGRLIDAEATTAGKARRICDWLAGLTDGMIVRTYRRLHDPDFGSLRDLS